MGFGIQTTYHGPPKAPIRRFKVTRTGDVGIALGNNKVPTVITRDVALGDDRNISLVDLYNEETGEVRTYRWEFLEEIDPPEAE